MLIERYHWTPEQIDRIDADIYDELVDYISATNDRDLETIKAQNKKTRRKSGAGKGTPAELPLPEPGQED